jgi:hypothetical protein
MFDEHELMYIAGQLNNVLFPERTFNCQKSDINHEGIKLQTTEYSGDDEW